MRAFYYDYSLTRPSYDGTNFAGFNLGSVVSDVGHFVSNAVKTAGKAVGAVTKAIGDATGAIGNALAKIPFVGPLLHGIWGLASAPFDLAASIIEGESLDKAFIDNFKSVIADVKEVAPYVKAVMSFIPGVGTLVSAAIGAATAIVEGQPITEVILSAVAGAIPGGDLASDAFHAAAAIVQGKGIANAVIAALPIPDEAKPMLSGALSMVESVAEGKAPGDALVQATMAALPSDVQDTLKSVGADKLTGKLADAAWSEAVKKGVKPEQMKGLQTGVAMAHAQRLQQATTAAASSSSALQKLAQDGQTVVSHTPVAAEAEKLLQGQGVDGFLVGLGLMQYRIDQHSFTATRAALSATDQHGFNLAVSLHIGRVRSPAPPATNTAAHNAGFFVSKGMQGAREEVKAHLMTLVSANAKVRAGAQRAVEQIARARGIAPPPKPAPPVVHGLRA